MATHHCHCLREKARTAAEDGCEPQDIGASLFFCFGGNGRRTPSFSEVRTANSMTFDIYYSSNTRPIVVIPPRDTIYTSLLYDRSCRISIRSIFAEISTIDFSVVVFRCRFFVFVRRYRDGEAKNAQSGITPPISL